MKKRNVLMMVAAVCAATVFSACSSADVKEVQEAVQEVKEAVEEYELESNSSADESTAEGTTETSGAFSVYVPGGWEFKIGDFMDENDTRYFSVKKGSFTYFDFKDEGEETAMNQYNYNHDTYTNEQEDVSGTFGSQEWTGFQYSDGFGGYGFEAYTYFGDKILRVSAAGNKFDADVVKEVLGSVVYDAASDTSAAGTEG